MVAIYSGLPQIGIKFGVFTSVLVALISNEAAYMAEIIRGGFLAIPPGQTRCRQGARPHAAGRP